jgi:hypothetical protein
MPYLFYKITPAICTKKVKLVGYKMINAAKGFKKIQSGCKFVLKPSKIIKIFETIKRILRDRISE